MPSLQIVKNSCPRDFSNPSHPDLLNKGANQVSNYMHHRCRIPIARSKLPKKITTANSVRIEFTSHSFVPMTNQRLLADLQKGELWHCTRPSAFEMIISDGFIKPNAGPKRSGTKPSAAQYMCAVPLFDWLAPGWKEVLDRTDIWAYFSLPPVTMAIGLDPSAVPGELVWYPATRDLTSKQETGQLIGSPFPFVEVFHRGPIPLTAVTRILAISQSCHDDYVEFHGSEVQDLRLVLRGFPRR